MAFGENAYIHSLISSYKFIYFWKNFPPTRLFCSFFPANFMFYAVPDSYSYFSSVKKILNCPANANELCNTRKYPLRGQILGSGVPGTPRGQPLRHMEQLLLVSWGIWSY